MNDKYIVTINSQEDVLICSKQFKKFDDTFNYISDFNLDVYRVNIYCIQE